MRNRNINHADMPPTTTPNAAPAPTTIINLPLNIAPGAAGQLWHDAVIEGRTAYFFEKGLFIGSTAPNTELDAWIATAPHT